ncbi:MAG: endolytic transglycosylase MltG [Nitrospirae bacterium]|nr:endolytic transglycosylase MltG [Nitrospirota bacterium]
MSTSKTSHVIAAVSLSLSGVVLFVAIYAALALFMPVARGGEVGVCVPNGTGYRQALALFRKNGVINAEFPLVVLARWKGVGKQVKPGLYKIPKDASPLEVFERIRQGMAESATLRVPEGFNLDDIAARVEKLGLVPRDKFLKIARDPASAKRFSIDAPSLEGFLFPDTYAVPVCSEPDDIVGLMVKRFKSVTGNEISGHRLRNGLSLLQTITLASIVEKEAKTDSERPVIAGVYMNRIRKAMRLEADPTINYGMKPSGSPIMKSDIRRPTPYNTYVISGLPPGPIANPGMASIRAALNPAGTDYLYFMANGDGTHQFSKTYRDHLRAVKRYRDKR